MPKYKCTQEYLAIVAEQRSEYKCYGVFHKDERGMELAEDYLEKVSDMHPNLDFQIGEKTG